MITASTAPVSLDMCTSGALEPGNGIASWGSKMKLTNKMHDAVKNSEVGKFIDRLIREEVARGGNTDLGQGGNVIQQLWAAFMKG